MELEIKIDTEYCNQLILLIKKDFFVLLAYLNHVLCINNVFAVVFWFFNVNGNKNIDEKNFLKTHF